MPDERSANALIHETSPYLLQHAHNPVAWNAWTDEAFERARNEDKPVFVSIGYSTCHWCHVMERESFEDADVAEFLNASFICIKVDREERPDVDAYCMDVCQAMTGHGGWPLTIVMDSDRRPFFAGTYFPKLSTPQRLGFSDLMERIHDVWQGDRQRVLETASNIMEMLNAASTSQRHGVLGADILRDVADYHDRTFDDTYGGFGIAPKFPAPHHLLLLHRAANRFPDAEYLRLSVDTLTAMRAGGMYDHVDGGFHRYSTDREWHLPHFEKMLYDQSMLLRAFVEAWQLTGNTFFRTTAYEIIEFVDRRLRTREGAYATAIDADSDGREGAHCMWTVDEWCSVVNSVTSDRSGELWAARFGLTHEGNVIDEATGSRTGENVPRLGNADVTRIQRDDQWLKIRDVLRTHRDRRPQPRTDDKVLRDLNGLHIMALAIAGRAFADAAIIDRATSAYEAVNRLCGDFRTYRDGRAHGVLVLDDVAAMGLAAVHLYQSTGNDLYLEDARRWVNVIRNQFLDEEGLPRRTSADTTDVPVRQRDVYDGAYPSSTSMAAELFATIASIIDDEAIRDEARAMITGHAKLIQEVPQAFCMLISVYDMLTSEPSSLTVFRENHNTVWDTSWAPEIGKVFLPSTVIRYDAGPEALMHCRGTSCSLPVSSLDAVRSLLAEVYV
ncbi:MAG TPA: thioredoxin domain-containing protein [Chlorobiota bacterium]|nr:thioredoxin domain-containing protein [Chlorobiota bacterium]